MRNIINEIRIAKNTRSSFLNCLSLKYLMEIYIKIMYTDIIRYYIDYNLTTQLINHFFKDLCNFPFISVVR